MCLAPPSLLFFLAMCLAPTISSTHLFCVYTVIYQIVSSSICHHPPKSLTQDCVVQLLCDMHLS